MPAILAILALTACEVRRDDAAASAAPAESEAQAAVETPAVPAGPRETVTGANGLTIELPAGVTRAMLGDRDIEALSVQVLLDRTRHSPGVIDGYMGENVVRAMREYRAANGLPESDAIDVELLAALLEDRSGDIFRTYTITERDARGRFRQVPEDLAAQARMDRIGYETPREMLAERFHMDEDFLAALNPRADFARAGTQIVIVSHGADRLKGEVARIEVRKASNSVVALNDGGEVLASYPASIGSDEFPTPSGSMQVAAVVEEANYTFDNERQEWGPDESFIIPPGPNNPVGGIWIGLAKAGYGIHGSPDPHLVGKTVSHGCVRLTNWDAVELAGAVGEGVEVEFV